MPTTYDGTILDQGGGVYNAKSAAYGAKGDEGFMLCALQAFQPLTSCTSSRAS